MHSVASLVQHFSGISAREVSGSSTGERHKNDNRKAPLQEPHDPRPEEMEWFDNRAIEEVCDEDFDHETSCSEKKTIAKDEPEIETAESKKVDKTEVKKTHELQETEHECKQEQKGGGDGGSAKEAETVTKCNDCEGLQKQQQETETMKEAQGFQEKSTLTKSVRRPKRVAPPPPVTVTDTLEGHSINGNQVADNSETSISENIVSISEATVIENNNYSSGNWQDCKKNRKSYPVILNPFLEDNFSGKDSNSSTCMLKMVADTSSECTNRSNINRLGEPMKEVRNKDTFDSLKQHSYKYPEEFNPFADSDNADSENIVTINLVGNASTVTVDESRMKHGHNVNDNVDDVTKSNDIRTAKRQPVSMSPTIGQNNSYKANYSSLKKKRAPLPPRNIQAESFALHAKNTTISDSYPEELNPF